MSPLIPCEWIECSSLQKC